MTVTFQHTINWPNNDLLIPASLFGIQVPAGLSSFHVRQPNIVDATRMNQVARSGTVRSSGGSLGQVNGLVTPELRMRFTNFSRQWRRLPTAGGQSATHGPCRFQFSGGVIFLDLTLSIFILNVNRPIPQDPISNEIFATVYNHELLHVLDAINIVTNWLQPRVRADRTVSGHLVNAQPFVFGTVRQRINQVVQEFRRHIQTTLQTAINNLFAREANRRTGLRDAPAQYRIAQQRIDALRIRQVNR